MVQSTMQSCHQNAFVQLIGKLTTRSSCCAFCYSLVAQQHFATQGRKKKKKKKPKVLLLGDVQNTE